MLASAARIYVNRFGGAPGRSGVLFTNNDGAYRTALDLADSGVRIAAIVDLRQNPQGALPAAARAQGIAILAGHGIVPTKGKHRVTGLRVAPLGAAAPISRPARDIPCDLVCLSGGWNPTVHLFSPPIDQLPFD